MTPEEQAPYTGAPHDTTAAPVRTDEALFDRDKIKRICIGPRSVNRPADMLEILILVDAVANEIDRLMARINPPAAGRSDDEGPAG